MQTKSFFTQTRWLVTIILTAFSIGQMWGAITNNNDGTYTEPSGTGSGTGSGSSYYITWSYAGGNITVIQYKGKGGTSVSSSYRSAARIYQYHYLDCSASGGFKIDTILTTYDGNYKGAGVAGGSSISSNVVGGTGNVTSTLATGNSGGTHSFRPTTAGAKAHMYVQNCQSGSTNTQLRLVSGGIKVAYSYTAPTAVAKGTVTSSSFGLTITDALNTNSYEVYFNTTGSAPNASTAASATVDSKTPTISSGVSANQTYYVWVRSKKTISSDTWKSSWVALTGNTLSTPSAAACSDDVAIGTASLNGSFL